MTPPAAPEAETSRRMSSEERRQQILEAAIAVFGAKGYVGTTTDEVARAASVSQPYVVRLFGTKENLFLAALGSVLDQLLRAFDSVPRDPDVHAYSKAIGEAYVGLLSVRGLHQTLSHAFLLGGHPVIGPVARAGFARVWQYVRDLGFSPDETQRFLADGMLINTIIGLRLSSGYGTDQKMTELLDWCFPETMQTVLREAPRTDEPW